MEIVQPEIDSLPLTETEKSLLQSAEAAIDRGIKATWEMWQALALIRERRLYREDYPTFEEYCLHRWGMTKVHAYRLIGAAEVRHYLSESQKSNPLGYFLPENERQTRPLTKLKSPLQVQEAWNRAVEIANGKPTAAQVVEVVNSLLGGKASENEFLPRKKRVYSDEEKELGICEWKADGANRYFGVNLHDQEVGMEIEKIAADLGRSNAAAISKSVEAYRLLPQKDAEIAELKEKLVEKDQTIAQLTRKLAEATVRLESLPTPDRPLPEPPPSHTSVSNNGTNLIALIDFFDRAAEHKSAPSVQITLDERTVVIARNSAKYPGCLNISDWNGNWHGRINRDGSLTKSRDWQEWVKPILIEFAADPIGTARQHGKSTGCCCFCNRPLTDERSLAVGYGAICAKHYGLPWDETETTDGTPQLVLEDKPNGDDEIPFDLPQSAPNKYQVGDKVEILSARHGEQYLSLVGTVVVADSDLGCVVQVGEKKLYCFYDELAVLQQKNRSNNLSVSLSSNC